jgi:hypothetical protein
MEREVALRKLVAMKKIRVDLGASPQEEDNARRISENLMRKHEISADDVIRFKLSQQGNMPIDWAPWERVVRDSSLELDRFGSRGQIRLPDETIVFVSLDRGDLGNWRALQRTCRIGAGASPHTLRQFLSGRAGKRYSLRSYPTLSA